MIIDGHVFLGKTIYMEQDPETLIANMDRFGVDVSVVVAPPPGPFYSEANKFVLNTMKKYPGRFTALYRVNPHLEGEDEKCKEALKQGFSGLQLDPTNDGYGVGSEIMEPVVIVAEDAKAPVYIHSGDSIFCPPESIVDYASKFEDVKFVTNTSRRAFRAVSGCENLYIMSRPFPILAFQKRYADRFDINRFVFASDAPLGSLEIEMKSIELANLDKEHCEKILRGNLKKILKI